MKQTLLLLDFGSTYTKGTLIDLQKELVMAQSTVKTQVQTNLMESYEELTTELATTLNVESLQIDETLICSSAFGGFKMVAIGLTDSLTMAAAKRVAFGAGTRLLKAYTYHLSLEDVREIADLTPDVILLTGGTDGGNQQFILNSAEALTHLERDIPIIVAGNQQAIPAVARQLAGTTYFLSENVMPKVNILQAEQTRTILREIFFKKIIYAKGLREVATLSPFPIIPTPTAVLSAADLLAKGYQEEPGWGDLAIVDVGGATTDVHSASDSQQTDEFLYVGLPEPFLKRTVEGDLGMRYSAVSLLETAGVPYFKAYAHASLTKKDIADKCHKRAAQPEFIPTSESELAMDQVIAKIAVDIAMDRHVGILTRERRPTHDAYYQQGKDLRHIQTFIGTGGVITHSPTPKALLAASFQKDELKLKPQAPKCYLDQDYLLSALGLLAEHYPAVALRMMTRYLIPL